jgi:hypothetical protein
MPFFEATRHQFPLYTRVLLCQSQVFVSGVCQKCCPRRFSACIVPLKIKMRLPWKARALRSHSQRCLAANTRWSRQRLRRSLYRRFLTLLVDLSREAVPPTRRCGSAFPLAAHYDRRNRDLSRLVLLTIVGLIIFILTNIAAFALHFGLWLLPLGDTLALDLLGMAVSYWLDIYHISYLLAASSLSTLIGVAWLVAVAPKNPRLHQLQVAAIPPLSLLCAGLLCSVFWAIRRHWMFHDIQPVPFPSFQRLAALAWFGVRESLTLAPSIAFCSFPWNLLWCTVVYFVIVASRNWLISVDSKGALSSSLRG